MLLPCSDEIEDAVGSQRSSKKSKKAGAESSKAVKAFLDEWSDAATDWTPEPEVITKLETLRDAVRERTFFLHLTFPISIHSYTDTSIDVSFFHARGAVEQAAPITKVFPRVLDDALRAVDKLVVEAHPNKWRVNGYFATLMTFLPFTKQYLKVWVATACTACIKRATDSPCE